MIGNFQQIDDTEETRLSCQPWRDIQKANRRDGIHLDFTFLHPIPAAGFDLRARPDPDTTRNLSTSNSLAKTLCKRHERESTPETSEDESHMNYFETSPRIASSSLPASDHFPCPTSS